MGWIINIMVTLYGLVRSWNKLSIWSMACHQESRPQILKPPSYHDVISTLHYGFQWTSELRTALATKSPDFEREDKWNFIKGCLDWGPLVCQIVGFVGMLENQVVSKPKPATATGMSWIAPRLGISVGLYMLPWAERPFDLHQGEGALRRVRLDQKLCWSCAEADPHSVNLEPGRGQAVSHATGKMDRFETTRNSDSMLRERCFSAISVKLACKCQRAPKCYVSDRGPRQENKSLPFQNRGQFFTWLTPPNRLR